MLNVRTVSRWRIGRIMLLWLLLSALLPAGREEARATAAEAPDAEDRAELRVSGYGILGNRRLKNMLRLIEDKREPRPYFDANFVEDSVLILIARVRRDGYLNPRIVTGLTLDDGSEFEYEWTGQIDEPLPRPLRVRGVHFQIERRVLYYYGDLEFTGLESIQPRTARGFFVQTGALLPLKRTRIYTPEGLRRGLSNLTESLQRMGYENARAHAAQIDENHESGRTRVRIEVTEGQQAFVRSVRQELFYEGDTAPSLVSTLRTNTPYSRLWLQDYAQLLRATNYARGFPDTTVAIATVERAPVDDEVHLDLLARIETGPPVILNEVRFTGHERTAESVLHRRARLDAGELLNRIEAEQGRFRLARLGIFESVEMSIEDVGDNRRDVVYGLREGRQIDMSLLLGYGSYELVRAGFEIEQFNVFGRAHHARLRAIQSVRSSFVDYTYTMPEFVGEDVNVFLNLTGLRREEIAFTREEFGGGLGMRRFFTGIASDVSVRYDYQILNAAEPQPFFGPDGLRNAAVGALISQVRHDRRDNPLYPREGYRIFSTLELASEYLAGDVNYQRLEFAGAYHQPLDPGRWLHFGVSHGTVFTIDGPERDLPFNRRFFPGGETSVRGYQLGEAAPRDNRGRLVGAETFTSASIEFEQSLTEAWSVVGFFDAVGFAREIENYPFNEGLFSVGGGIRWRTVIGPARLEYGHNLNPRPLDPSGTIHFSIGFPF